MLLEVLYFSPFHKGELNVSRILSQILLLILSRRQHIFWLTTVWLVLILDWTEGDKEFDKWIRSLGVCMGMLMLVWKFRGFENIGFAVRMIV
jgi:hypothetical protein